MVFRGYLMLYFGKEKNKNMLDTKNDEKCYNKTFQIMFHTNMAVSKMRSLYH